MPHPEAYLLRLLGVHHRAATLARAARAAGNHKRAAALDARAEHAAALAARMGCTAVLIDAPILCA